MKTTKKEYLFGTIVKIDFENIKEPEIIVEASADISITDNSYFTTPTIEDSYYQKVAMAGPFGT